MRVFEKDLKKLLNYLDKTGSRALRSSLTGLDDKSLRFLAAKGLIDLIPYKFGDNDSKVRITDAGITYFSDKFDRIARYSITVLISFVTSLIVTLLAK